MTSQRLVRATNYFTLAELLRWSHAKVWAAWHILDEKGLADTPLPTLPGSTFDALGLDRALTCRAHRYVEASMKHLDETDQVLERGSEGFPTQLMAIDRPPQFLFIRGNLELLRMPIVAVVGTRRPSAMGRERAFKIAYLLAKAGIVVASGLARGIDAYAHRGALAAGGLTLAVLGTPLTRVYPREHEGLQEIISETGLLVSQFYPGARVREFFFPMRNAVMSGLSLGTIVVEASETSGALIQARECLKQGRKLFIPRSAVANPNLAWPRQFESKGAVIFSEVDDLLQSLRVHQLLPASVTEAARLKSARPNDLIVARSV